jgi:NADPH:quinone reductase-like Zn-dependent oxidoreductase
VILDNVGNHSLRSLRRALVPDGTLVAVAGGKGGPLLGGLTRKLRVKLFDPFVKEELATFTARIGKDDLLALKELVEAGKVRPVVDRAYPLSDAAEAIRYVETGHARGKVVITV